MKQLRGVIIQNLIYLFVFFAIYFPLVAFAPYIKDTICDVETFTEYCNDIPAGTVTMMNALLWVIVPITAIIWAIIASTTPQRQEYQ